MTDVYSDWSSHQEFYSFSSGRFVYDEKEQVTQRETQFDANELARIAAEAIGSKECVEFQKYTDGLYNKVFVLTMDDGKEVIAKIPCSNAGLPHFTTASEVATMDFVRNVLGTPAPKVYAWNSKTDAHNSVGAEYIIMEKISGIHLADVWDELEPSDKLKVVVQVFKYQRLWTTTKFTRFGGLYYAKDVDTPPLFDECLYIDKDGQAVEDSRFAVGPAVSRECVNDGKQKIQCDRGPWDSLLQYYLAGARREKSSLEHLQYIPKQLVIFYGPGIYIPTKARKLVALDSFFRVVGSILPTDPALVSANLWHNDLHAENIFVDPAEPTKVLGIIDWQSVSIEPLFSHLLEPSFLNYGGPEIEDDLQRPAFPDTKSLSKEEKAAAFELYLDQCLMIAWRMLVHKKNPAQYAAIKFRETNIASILFLSQNIFSLGEAHFRAVLLALQDEWAELHPNTAFPITFSDEEVAEIQRDIESAERGIRIMQTIREQLGDLWPERGIIEHEYYDVVMEKLASIKRDLMAKYVKSEVERREFEHFWPFEC